MEDGEPSVDERDGRAESQTDTGAANGKRRRASSSRKIGRARRDREPARRPRRVARSSANAASTALSSAASDDQGVEPVPATRGQTAHAVNVLQRAREPPPTEVGHALTGGTTRSRGLPTTARARRARSVEPCIPRKDAAMHASTKVFGRARIRPGADRTGRASASRYLHFTRQRPRLRSRPAHAPGSCSSTPATTRPQTAATPPTAARSSCARTGTTPTRA